MTAEIIEIEISKIKIDYDVYPREEVDNNQVNLYRQNLAELPPIQLTKEDFTLIDGMHRLRAHEIEGKLVINAEIEDLQKDYILIEAIKRNSKHGKQLEENDKRNQCRRLFEIHNGNFDYCSLFSVDSRTIRRWTADLKADLKKEIEKKIVELYLQYKKRDEIVELLKVSSGKVSAVLESVKNGQLSNNDEPDSFQISDVWRFSGRDSRYGTDGYPGSIPGQVLENFLHYFSKPFDVVVDPMVGGGTTLDVCKRMFRRYQGYDLHPLHTRADINFNDIRKGFPEKAKSCDLIYLDPPYWHSMSYKEDSSDKLSRKDFIEFINLLAVESYKTVKKGGIVGFICEDIMKPAKGLYKGEPDEQMLSMIHLAPLFEKAGFELIWRIHVPLTLGQYDGNRTKIAKESKVMLHIVRDLLIWRK